MKKFIVLFAVLGCLQIDLFAQSFNGSKNKQSKRLESYLNHWLVVSSDINGVIDSMEMWEGRSNNNYYREYIGESMMVQNNDKVLIVDFADKIMYLNKRSHKGKQIKIDEKLLSKAEKSLDSMATAENWPLDTASIEDSEYKMISDSTTGLVTKITYKTKQSDSDNPDEIVSVNYTMDLVEHRSDAEEIKRKCDISQYMTKIKDGWKPIQKFSQYEFYNLIDN